ncbi:hypothetical protein [Paenibacillus endoradicis]|uniref:hypothetical protein n=1 Tax=Paenibacillus endoradicis TaxID=2972487 RepID=UPI002158CBC6|nr:hypothetical protein [Paenibacillus endoradicis]MCR8659085.1 hypothetical protein [Paenibacillus endoradicis]
MNVEQETTEINSQLQEKASHAPIQEEFEADAIKQYVLLEMILRIIDHDVKAIGLSQIKLPRLYESMLRAIQDRVLLDMADHRRMFRKGGIKIYEELQQQDGLLAKYVCRGYHHQIFMLWGFVKVECERVLKKYMSV